MHGYQNISLQFFTRSLPCITELYSLFYVNKVNGIPHNIYDLLTPVALAHIIFFMSAGDKIKNVFYIYIKKHMGRRIYRKAWLSNLY
jgi:hypothetical protein